MNRIKESKSTDNNKYLENWTYDGNGNILTHEVEGKRKTHTYNYTITKNNQLEGVDSKAYTYDKIGSLQTDGTKRLDWTVYGKLAEVSNVLKNTQFFYDATGNNFEKPIKTIPNLPYGITSEMRLEMSWQFMKMANYRREIFTEVPESGC